MTAKSATRGPGLALAVLSAAAFGTSGPLGSGLLDAGWTPAAAVAARVLVAGGLLLVPALVVLRGRWHLLRVNLPLVVGYGALAVAGCQLAYFNAIAHLQVGVALLIEYAAPVAVVGWLWARGGQRPGALTMAGSGLAVVGLALVLDVADGFDLDPAGVVWALAAMLGLAAYFLLSAPAQGSRVGLPPLVLATAGLLLGGLLVLAAGLVGLVPLTAGRGDVHLANATVAWWLPISALAVISAALAYTTGIAAVRRLGPRLAAFVALTEVLFALAFAWLLLDELPQQIQLIGGAVLVAGVVLVRAGEGPPHEPVAAVGVELARVSGRSGGG